MTAPLMAFKAELQTLLLLWLASCPRAVLICPDRPGR